MSCHSNRLKSIVLLGSSCIYQNFANNQLKVYLLSDKLEETNKAYAVTKIAGAILAESFNYQYKAKFKFLMPCHNAGPNDDMMKKFTFFPSLEKIYDAKKNKKKNIILWGSGEPLES